jgi:hypothetical protein
MSSEAVQHHRKAAERFAHAAKHHMEAGTHYSAGRHEQAAREAYLAHGHSMAAGNQAVDVAKLYTRHRRQK